MKGHGPSNKDLYQVVFYLDSNTDSAGLYCSYVQTGLQIWRMSVSYGTAEWLKRAFSKLGWNWASLNPCHAEYLYVLHSSPILILITFSIPVVIMYTEANL